MKRRRVKITGIGPVTPAGIGREAFWKGILEPISRVRNFNKLDAALGAFVAAFIDRFRIEDFVGDVPLPKGIARHTLFALAGAKLAIRDAGLTLEELNHAYCAVVAGSSLMDFDGIGRTVEGVVAKGVRGALPRTVYTTNASVIPATIIEFLGISGRALALQTSCCAGIDAIGHAARMVASGEAEIAICGGTEAPLFRCPLVELRATGLTPATNENVKKIDRPFDLWRTTGVVSEGACMLVLEPESSPRRGYSFVSGYSFANDADQELCSGLSVAIKCALAEAGLRREEVDNISAWGPGHSKVDAAECVALREVFGARLPEISAGSIKGAIGNPLGGAAAIQIGAAALAQRHEILPPTVNWEFPDPECPLNLSARPRSLSHNVTIVNAHGLSGVNSCVVLQRC